MVTANIIFAANGRIYHLIAGYTLFGNRTVEEASDEARQDVEVLLAGFEVLDGGKHSK